MYVYNTSHKYIKWYLKLIRNALSRSALTCYYENHHIFPKSIFGQNSFIVALTAREHFIAHLLLYKIFLIRYGKNKKQTQHMAAAFILMSNHKNKQTGSRLYQQCKEILSFNMTGKKNPMSRNNYIFTIEHRKKISEAGKGRLHTENHKQNQRIAWKARRSNGQVMTKEQRQKAVVTKRQNLKKFNFIHCSGTIEYNITAWDLSQKYPDHKLSVSKLQKAFGYNTKTYNTHKGWRILTDQDFSKPTRKLDSRTIKKLSNLGVSNKFDTLEEALLSCGITKNALYRMRPNPSHFSNIVTCPHCGKTGRGGTMARWHYDKCKEKVNE